jgi:mono/diheme cytochrome c family protein
MSYRRKLSVSAVIGALALCIGSSAGAQENLDKGKTAAQLYASDCAICHKSPQSISQAPGVFGLESFLREHYTASRESAASIVAYLKKLEKPSAGLRRGQAAMRTSQRKSSEPVLRESDERGLRPPANIPRPPANIRP